MELCLVVVAGCRDCFHNPNSSPLLLQNPNSSNPRKSTHKELAQKVEEFMPNLWSYEFELNWKEWIVPRDAVLVESNVENDGVFFSVLSGRIV